MKLHKNDFTQDHFWVGFFNKRVNKVNTIVHNYLWWPFLGFLDYTSMYKLKITVQVLTTYEVFTPVWCTVCASFTSYTVFPCFTDDKDMDHQPGPAVAALMKLSFDEEHRHAICSLGEWSTGGAGSQWFNTLSI